MKIQEIKEELALCARSFIEAKERSCQHGIDDFDTLRILEASFNRLFISVEHMCNAIVLLETGNFSKKHFGDFRKLGELKDKYAVDLEEMYQTTYNFRSYADYRKCPEIQEKFTKNELKQQISIVQDAIQKCLGILGQQIDIKDVSRRLTLKQIHDKEEMEETSK